MSYDILYRSLFIRDGEELVPLIEIGPSNCYESRKPINGGYSRCGRRVREWAWLTTNNGKPITNQKLMQDEIIRLISSEGTYDHEYLKYKGKWISKKDFARKLAYWTNNARIPVDIAGKCSITFVASFYNGTWDDVTRVRMPAFDDTASLGNLTERVTKFLERNKGLREKYLMSPEVYAPDSLFKKEKKPYDPTKPYWIIRIPSMSRYVVKVCRGGYSWCESASRARRYTTERSAKNAARNLTFNMFPQVLFEVEKGGNV